MSCCSLPGNTLPPPHQLQFPVPALLCPPPQPAVHRRWLLRLWGIVLPRAFAPLPYRSFGTPFQADSCLTPVCLHTPTRCTRLWRRLHGTAAWCSVATQHHSLLLYAPSALGPAALLPTLHVHVQSPGVGAAFPALSNPLRNVALLHLLTSSRPMPTTASTVHHHLRSTPKARDTLDPLDPLALCVLHKRSTRPLSSTHQCTRPHPPMCRRASSHCPRPDPLSKLPDFSTVVCM